MKIVQEITVPQESVNDKSLNVVGINFANGDFVKKGETIIELETSKTILTLEAEYDGYIKYFCKIGDEVEINQKIIILTESKLIEEISLDHSHKEVSKSENKIKKDISFSSVFSKKALELIEKNNLKKSDFDHLDFITENDIQFKISPQDFAQNQSNPIKSKKNIPSQELNSFQDITIAKLSTSKKREIEYLSAVQGDHLNCTLQIHLELNHFFAFVNPYLNILKDSLLPVITYEISRLLLQYKLLNSFFINNSIAFYDQVNIGIAIDIDDGLKVVKIPSTDKKSILEIEEKILDLSNKYLDKKLQTSDLTDITFTITDLSAFGISSFTPLINKDNAAILGISAIDSKLNRVTLSLTFDHRVTEGKLASQFLNELKGRIESYSVNTKNDITVLDEFYKCSKCNKKLSEDLNKTGFIKIINSSGEEKLICDSCFSNW